jgi:CheY-like chemotaxis protein
LFQSQKMESIGQLTGGVAHDFNNLLSIISSAVEVLGTQLTEAPQRAVLSSIHRAVDRGAKLTQQLLAFARQQPLLPLELDIDPLIQRFEPVLRRAVPSSVKFSVNCTGDAKWVCIDESRFEAALLNLVVNARDAMPDGGTLSITSGRHTMAAGEAGQLPAGQYVAITVTDTGAGMNAAVQAKAFEPFFTTKEVGKGTGLGLSQVQGFIAQSGGGVRIESAPSAGTSIHLLLPQIVPVNELQQVDAAREMVLIVEDEAELAALASSLFESLGYQVLLAYNADDALRMLATNPGIDVLFTDVVMPGKSGFELGRQVREQYPATKIIVASGYPLPALGEHASLDEFSFVSKPYRLSEIVKNLR